MGFSRYQHPAWKTLGKILLARSGLKRYPVFANLLLTYRCNLRCQYCAVWEEPRDELHSDEICILLDQLAASGCERVSLSGGEPMSRKDIGPIINHVKALGLTVNLVSNGFQIPERITEIAAIDFLSISLDGKEETHDLLRGKGSYQQAIEAIRIARAQKIEVWITCVLTRHNIGEIPHLLHLATQEAVRISFLPAMAEALKPRNISSLTPTPQQWQQAMLELQHELTRRHTPMAMSSALINFYRNYYAKRPPEKKRQGAFHAQQLKCQAGRLFVGIAPNGKLYPCHFLIESREGCDTSANRLQSALTNQQLPDCDGCWCDSFIEANLLFALNPAAVAHIWQLLQQQNGD